MLSDTRRPEPVIRPYAATDKASCLDVWLRASRVGHPFLSAAEVTEQKALVAETHLPNAETGSRHRTGRNIR